MAFSPLPTLGVKPAHNAEPGKHKALAMLNKKPVVASSSPATDASGTEAMPEDFADQMNQQERNKYVKGPYQQHQPISTRTNTCRQEIGRRNLRHCLQGTPKR